MLEYFFAFFVFCSQKMPFFFAKNQYTKKMATIVVAQLSQRHPLNFFSFAGHFEATPCEKIVLPKWTFFRFLAHCNWLNFCIRKSAIIILWKCNIRTIFTILLTLWNSEKKNGLLIKLFLFFIWFWWNLVKL